MKEDQTEPNALAPLPVPITAAEVDALLNVSDVNTIKLVRESRQWRCEVRGLRAAGGATASSLVEAVHDAVVAHNIEWHKVIGA